MQAIELKSNVNIAKNPHLINSLNRSHNHPLIRKYSHIRKVENYSYTPLPLYTSINSFFISHFK